MKLVWREEALGDLETVLDYIADRDARAALKLNADIEACARRLPEHPFLYRPGRTKGTREAVVHPNYILVYRVREDAIEIVSVIHTRRQYPFPD